ncbi:hypothetical protein [Streptomyces sp. NPDC006610]|uniref:hypothetical protein n=1 Tax=Streptomyces sp. NPDC006610 TaxID=3154584 RepID=UPI0033BF81A2
MPVDVGRGADEGRGVYRVHVWGCVRRKVDAFLLHGSLPDRGGSCGAEERTSERRRAPQRFAVNIPNAQ